MITLRNVTKSFGAQTLFEDATLQINEGDRFALVGPNGAGKSTLFKLIMGMDAPDDGEIALRTGIRFGYLPQETAQLSGRTVVEEVLNDDYADPRLEAQAKKILMGLGFRVSDFERRSNEFSGGWQMRIMIARLLVQEPDLLMLDEPTNHLDLESLLWFQNHLLNYRGAIFLISHDREFINALVDRIVEVREAKLNVYRGTFEEFQEQKKLEKERLIAAYERQRKEIEELQLFINRFRAKASLAASVQSKIKYLERMDKIELPPEQKTVGFVFPQPERSGQVVLDLKNIHQSYDGKNWVYRGLDLTLERGQKIALVGPNGAGKSTLLKMMAGRLPFQSGERKLGMNVEVGYFSQHRNDMFKPNRTVWDEAKDTRRAHSETTIRTLLGSFLFSGDTVYKNVQVLSGGEKSRLGLVKILLDPPNVLLMDEPTTHLDIASVDMLVEALTGFSGTFCFISHDVYFIRKLANNVIHVNEGKITWYPGDYDYFLHKKSLEDSEEAALFRSEQAIEAAHGFHRGAAPAKSPGWESPAKTEEKEEASSGGGGRQRKSKEQKRREAEERNARYRAEQELKRQEDVRRPLLAERDSVLGRLADPATHADPALVKTLTLRLVEIEKALKTS